MGRVEKFTSYPKLGVRNISQYEKHGPSRCFLVAAWPSSLLSTPLSRVSEKTCWIGMSLGPNPCGWVEVKTQPRTRTRSKASALEDLNRPKLENKAGFEEEDRRASEGLFSFCCFLAGGRTEPSGIRLSICLLGCATGCAPVPVLLAWFWRVSMMYN